MRLLQMLYWSCRFKNLFPFLIRSRAVISIASISSLKLTHRLILGNSNKLPRVSILPVNIWFGKNAQVDIGKAVCIGPGVNLIVKDNARLKIGDSSYFTSDAHIEVVESLEIGSNCAISWGVSIIDSNHHDIYYENRVSVNKKLQIGDNVWIGCNSIILPGTVIGSGSTIAAGSVVKGDFPTNSLIAGNPAKVVREDVSWK